MKEAFRLFKDYPDVDGKISFHELHDKITDNEKEDKNTPIGNKLFFQMIKRIAEFPEMKNDKRITFDKFKLLILKAMNMRKNEHQVKLLFEVMDSNKAGRIYARDLKKTALSIGVDLHKNKCD